MAVIPPRATRHALTRSHGRHRRIPRPRPAKDPQGSAGVENRLAGRGSPYGTMVGMDDIVAFLTARYDEDEAVARAAIGDAWEADMHWIIAGYDGSDIATGAFVYGSSAAHIVRHDPARVLAEVAAKRRILALLTDVRGAELQLDGEFGLPGDPVVEEPSEKIAKALAAVYADHEDYRDEWRP